MRKKNYEQPRTDVVELRVTNQLLAGSTTGTGGFHEGPGEEDMN